MVIVQNSQAAATPASAPAPTPKPKFIAKPKGSDADLIKIKWIRVSDAVGLIYSGNAKEHDLQLLAESITRNGFVDPPKYDIALNGGAIVYGNGRVEALAYMEKNGWDVPRGIALDNEGKWVMPITVGVDSATDESARAFVLDHNNLTLAGGTFTALDMTRMYESGALLNQLDSLGWDAMITFDADDMKLIGQQLGGDLGGAGNEAGGGASGDGGDSDPAPGPKSSRVKLGEIWRLGRHFIACADSLNPQNVRELLGDRFRDVSMVWADAPYGMNLDTSYKNSHLRSSKNLKKSTGYPPVAGDDKPFDASGLLELFSSVKEQFWWGADYYRKTIDDGGSWLVWNKRAGLPEMDYKSSHFELCWSKQAHLREIIDIRWFGAMGMEQETGSKRVHPTQKPVALCEFVFGKYSAESAIIFDPFLGSAPSIMAAETMGDRLVYGFELSPDYCEVICQRFEALTGETPEKIGNLSTYGD